MVECTSCSLRQAYGITRQSSLTNAGDDKASERRQREAIDSTARRLGFEIVEWFSDPGVSGAKPLHERPGAAAAIGRGNETGIKVLFFEDGTRYARDLVVQETSLRMLKQAGFAVYVSGKLYTDFSDPTANASRQMEGVFAEWAKATTVKRLQDGRARVKALSGKSMAKPRLAALQPELAKTVKNLKDQGLSLRAISARLAEAGRLNSNGRAYGPSMLAKLAL